MSNEKNSAYEQALQQFTFEGDEKDIAQLHELIGMIASVPTGQRLFQDVLNRKTPLIVSFCDGFADKGVLGKFLSREQAVRLVKMNVNNIQDKIRMVNVLAHELQHHVDEPRNGYLFQNAHTMNEKILSMVLCEISAFWTGDSVESELRTLRGLPVKWMPKTPDDWKTVMSKALSGDNKWMKGYIDRRRAVGQKGDNSFEQKVPSKEFCQGVTDYFNKMNIPMNFAEAMLCVSQSQKLSPPVRPCQPSRDR